MQVFKVRDESGAEDYFATEAEALARRDSFRADGIDACAYRVPTFKAGSVEELVASLNGTDVEEEIV